VSSPTPFDDVTRRILQGQATEQVRSAAARGALPLPRVALVHLWLVLRADEVPEIRAHAESSLSGLAKDLLARWDAIKTIWYDENSRQFEEATKLNGDVMTSSPGPKPRARTAMCRAAVPLETATA